MLVRRSDPVGAVIIVVRAFSLNNLLRKRTNREKVSWVVSVKLKG
jgi:hypothetical protein